MGGLFRGRDWQGGLGRWPGCQHPVPFAEIGPVRRPDGQPGAAAPRSQSVIGMIGSGPAGAGAGPCGPVPRRNVNVLFSHPSELYPQKDGRKVRSCWKGTFTIDPFRRDRSDSTGRHTRRLKPASRSSRTRNRTDRGDCRRDAVSNRLRLAACAHVTHRADVRQQRLIPPPPTRHCPSAPAPQDRSQHPLRAAADCRRRHRPGRPS